MSITALGYIGVHSARLDDWSTLATGLLGMQQIDRSGATRVFRMDDRKQRFVVTGETGDRLAFTGWETANAAAMDALAGRLENHGVRVHHAMRALERFPLDLNRKGYRGFPRARKSDSVPPTTTAGVRDGEGILERPAGAGRLDCRGG